MPHDLNRLDTALCAYPRVALLEGPTPIQKLSRLSQLAEFNGCNLYVKRDDLTGLGGGGNKLRKLEFLLGEALAEGADTLVTWGGFQSNHARLTAAVAARHGLACELILTPSAVRSDDDFCYNGNVLLDGLFGAKVHRLARGVTPDSYAAELLDTLKSHGKNLSSCHWAVPALAAVWAMQPARRRSCANPIRWVCNSSESSSPMVAPEPIRDCWPA